MRVLRTAARPTETNQLRASACQKPVADCKYELDDLRRDGVFFDDNLVCKELRAIEYRGLNVLVDEPCDKESELERDVSDAAGDAG